MSADYGKTLEAASFWGVSFENLENLPAIFYGKWGSLQLISDPY